MVHILDAAEVLRGDGTWTHGVDYDAYGCLLSSQIETACGTDAPSHLSGPVPESGETYEDLSGGGGTAPVFAVSTFFQSRLQCSREEQAALVSDALEPETEKALGYVLENGVEGSDLFLQGPEVQRVSPTGGSQAALIKVLNRLWETAGVGPENTLVHLGLGVAFELASVLNNEEFFASVAGRLVTSPKYSDGLIAATGPLVVNLSSPQIIQTPNISNNRGMVLANRLASIQFDPCQAVLAHA